jgi:hypothetical protein
MKTGDIGNIITVTVKDRDGTIVNLTDATTATLRWKVGNAVVAEKVMTFVVPRTGGQVKYSTIALDLATSGVYWLEVKIVFADGKILYSVNDIREYVKPVLA